MGALLRAAVVILTRMPFGAATVSAVTENNDIFHNQGNAVDQFLRLTGGPEGAKVTSVAYAGSGCSPGSVSYAVNDENQGVSFSTTELLVSLGPGKKLDDLNKNCQVNMRIEYPESFQYTINMINTKGYGSLEDDGKVSMSGVYYFSGQQEQVCH
jgi:hypothetical protein